MKFKDIKEKTQNKWNVWVNMTKEFRDRFAARDMVNGAFLGVTLEFMTIVMKFLEKIMGQQSS